MRGLFRLLTIFDWVTPAWSWLDDLANDPTFLMQNSWSFFVPYGGSLENGWNAADINRLLRKHGIKTYGKFYTPYSVGIVGRAWPTYEGEQYIFSVPLNQARFAEYILQRNNVPLTASSLGAPAVQGGKEVPAGWEQQPGEKPVNGLWNLWGLL